MVRSAADSSKRKSSSLSSALKNKSRSQERNKKRGKLGTRKFKKDSRRDDSALSSDGYSSSSSDSLVSRSSSDIEPRKKMRSRPRKVMRHRRKRSKRHNSLNRCSSDDTTHVRKRKRSKRSRDTRGKKKRIRKEKRRREPSISSGTSSGSSEDSDSEYEREEKRSKRKGKDKRDLDNVRVQCKERHRSRSCSPRSLQNNDDICFQSEEKVLSEEPGSRRLRSIIVFTRGDEDEVEGSNVYCDDEQKDEIMYDPDGYPSSKSNDSNDGEITREVFNEMRTRRMKVGLLENLIKDNSVTVRVPGLPEIENLHEPEPDVNLPSPGEDENDDSLKDDDGKYTSDATANDDNLEAVLRQRALENLKKFRSGSQANAKRHALVQSTEATKLSAPTGGYQWHNQESLIEKFSIKDSNSKDQRSMEVSPSDVERVDSLPLSKNRVGAIQGNKSTIDHSGDKPKQAVSALKKEIHGGVEFLRKSPLPQGEVSRFNSSILGDSKNISENWHSLAQDTKKTLATPKETLNALVDPVNDKPMAVEPKLSKDHLKFESFLRKPPSEKSFAPVTSTSIQGEGNDDRSESLPEHLSVTSLNIEKNNSDIGTSEKHNEGQSSNKQENASNEGSQFQKKTMSVKRGGEIVKVSYKVYIPNKTPALARRKLKR